MGDKFLKTELFIIEPGLWGACNPVELQATCAALREMGLYALPYDHVTVRIKAKEIMHVIGNADHGVDIDDRGRPTTPFLNLDITISAIEGEQPKVVSFNELSKFSLDVTDRIVRENRNQTFAEDREHLRKIVCDFLISMLATRNAVKRTTVNKLAKLGIGKGKYKNRFTHVTTISLPRPDDMEDDQEHKPTGLHKAPHLRRGHIRHQHYGPKNAFTRAVLIPPVFVNADPDFVSKRSAYNVSSKQNAA